MPDTGGICGLGGSGGSALAGGVCEELGTDEPPEASGVLSLLEEPVFRTTKMIPRMTTTSTTSPLTTFLRIVHQFGSRLKVEKITGAIESPLFTTGVPH